MLRPDSIPGPQAAELSIEGLAVPDYGAHFNFFGHAGGLSVAVSPLRSFPLVSGTSPSAIYCRMLNVYGNISELPSLRWVRSAGVA